MNSRQRVIAVLERKTPDRLPTFEWKVDAGLVSSFAPGGDLMDFVEAADHDAICCSPVYEKTQIIDENTFVDEFQVKRCLSSADKYPIAIGHPIPNHESFKRYEPPPLDSPSRFQSIDACVERFGKDRAIIVNLHDVFSFPRDLIGFEKLLTAFVEEPRLVRDVVGMSVDYNLELARLVKRRGIEIIGIGDDFADNRGPFISPRMFREFLFPEFKRVVQGYKKLGFYVIKHSDGNLYPILDLLIEAGIDCLDPIDPLSGMDMGYMREQYGDRLARKGNVDCVKTLVTGSSDDVEREVKECIYKGSPGGGHIISTSNSLHAGIKPDLYKTMLSAVRRYGTYPIRQ